VAPGANAPLFSKAGELHVAGHIDMASMEMDCQIAFSPMNRVGLIGGVSLVPRLDTKDKTDYYGELGVGTFLTFGPGRFEAFAGGGMGRTWGNLGGDGWNSGRSNYLKLFAQANVGMSAGWFDFGLTLRIASLNFDYLQNGNKPGAFYLDAVFIEPIGFVRLGWNMIKFEFQLGRIFPVRNDPLVNYIPVRASFGLHLSFDIFDRQPDNPAL
jgi:hypothetical protein